MKNILSDMHFEYDFFSAILWFKLFQNTGIGQISAKLYFKN